MAAAHHELGNLKVILDRNRIQNDDFCEEQMRMFDIPAKWKAFGWNVKEINGHDMTEVMEGLDFLEAPENCNGPSILIAHTVKGAGISYMENNPSFHGAAPNDEQFHQAMVELGEVEA
jgi:transketolase